MLKIIYNKIRDALERKIYLLEYYEDARNIDEVLLDKRLSIFKEVLNPRLESIGLKNWDGKYLWFSDFNSDGIKHVVGYNVLKGFSGGFTYGNCFYNVPTISGKRIINHRTDKSTIITYHKLSDGWQKSIEENRFLNPDRINTFNEEKFRKSLGNFIDNNLLRIRNWFVDNSTIDSSIDSLIKDANNPPFEIGRRNISYSYILAFLYFEKKNKEKTQYWIDRHFKNSSNTKFEKELILKRLNSQ